MPLHPSNLIYCKQTRHRGRGVFARVPIAADTVIEEVPVIVMPEADLYGTNRTSALANFVFRWRPGFVALALGYGSLYNHSYRPNARCVDVPPQRKRYVALRDIAADEEITFNYNGQPQDESPVGFQVK